jgi:hypothetical protein
MGAGLLSPRLMGLINQAGDGNIWFWYLHGVTPDVVAILTPPSQAGSFFTS